jgi:hypothetical protein
MSAWAIASSFTFPVTTRVLRQRCAWAEICLAGLWTTEFAAPVQSLTTRGNDGRTIFPEDSDYEAFWRDGDHRRAGGSSDAATANYFS